MNPFRIDTSNVSNFFMQELNVLGVPIEYRQAVSFAVYDEIITSVLEIIRKLNYTSVTKEDHATAVNFSSDPIADLQASNPKDFQIFVNIVEFCR